MPFTVAPDLFAISNSESHCVVKRQPQTADELERMYQAIEVAELDCIHYKGGDRVIRLGVHEARTGTRDKASVDAVRPTQAGWWKRLFIRLRL